MKPRRHAALPLAAALGLAACSVKVQPQAAWTILAQSGSGPARTSAEGPSLGVARFSAAPEIRTTDLTWRSEDGRRLNESQDRWVDYPDRMLEELTRSELLASGSFSSVGSAPPTTGMDLVLQARVLDFTEWHVADATDARVAVEWRLMRPGGELLAQDVVRTSAPLPERSVAGAVRAYQAASEQAVRDMVAAVIEAARKLRQG